MDATDPVADNGKGFCCSDDLRLYSVLTSLDDLVEVAAMTGELLTIDGYTAGTFFDEPVSEG